MIRPRVHRVPAGADPIVVIAGCLMFALVMFLPQLLNDGDTFWQISTGNWILRHHTIPATDPFSFTAGDRPWFAHEWLAETLLALAFDAAGLRGVMVLAAAAVGVTAALLLRHLRRFLPEIYALAGTLLALCNAAPSMLTRPHLLAWPCLVLWCGGLVSARADRAVPSYALLPVMLLWVNLHGSFMLGLLLPGALMIEALLDHAADRRQVAIGWARFIAAAWVVALLNPDFLAGVLFPFHLLGMHSLGWIGEWQAANFSGLQPLELVVLTALALGLSGKVVLPPVRLLIFLVLVHGALAHARNEQLLGLVGALILAEPLGASLGRGGATGHGPGWRHLPALAAAIAVVALGLRSIVTLDPIRSGAAFAAMLANVPPALRALPVLNDYALGGQLIFNGVRPFIDSRADLYGDAFLARYHRLAVADRTEINRTIREYSIAWTMFPSGHPMVQAMDGRPGWRRLVAANGIVIDARDDALR